MIQRIFTDGACSGNPGPGGWAAVFTLEESYEIISGHEVDTTNNRMELIAVVEALKSALENGYDKLGRIEIHSDSAYIVNAVTKGWLTKWKNNGWKTVKQEPVKNRELWEAMDSCISKAHKKVSFVKVKGHSGNTFNELADKRAVEESLKAQAKFRKAGGLM